MFEKDEKDNVYTAGTIITAKVAPQTKLKIERYYRRIYYCSVVDQPKQKHYAYFERELIAPG